jgi:RimJ/RimL family protein N-acetyltransferase
MISIRHAELHEKKKTYTWLCLSDTTSMHMGEPDFPESPIPDWNEFQTDFEDFYFLKSGRKKGSVMIIKNGQEEIGCVCYTCFHLKPYCAELDIWFRERKYCGNGLGPQTLKILLDYCTNQFLIHRFIIRPSEKNHFAIKSYQKVGFQLVENKNQAVIDFILPTYYNKYGQGDYGINETAILIKEY